MVTVIFEERHTMTHTNESQQNFTIGGATGFTLSIISHNSGWGANLAITGGNEQSRAQLLRAITNCMDQQGNDFYVSKKCPAARDRGNEEFIITTDRGDQKGLYTKVCAAMERMASEIDSPEKLGALLTAHHSHRAAWHSPQNPDQPTQGARR